MNQIYVKIGLSILLLVLAVESRTADDIPEKDLERIKSNLDDVAKNSKVDCSAKPETETTTTPVQLIKAKWLKFLNYYVCSPKPASFREILKEIERFNPGFIDNWYDNNASEDLTGSNVE